MDAAEHLVAGDDAVRAAFAQLVDHAAARSIDAWQAQHAHAWVQCLPGEIGGNARRTAAAADRCRLVHPGAARIAIDAGGRPIADPCARPGGQRRAIGLEHGIAAFARGRHG